MSAQDVVTGCWRGLELGVVLSVPGFEVISLLHSVSMQT